MLIGQSMKVDDIHLLREIGDEAKCLKAAGKIRELALLHQLTHDVAHSISPFTGREINRAWTVTVDGSMSTEQVVQPAGYDWINGEVTSASLPVRASVAGTVTMKLWEPGRRMTAEDAAEHIAAAGHLRPEYEHGLFYGRLHPEQQVAGPIAFPHAPYKDRSNRFMIIALTGLGGERNLGLYPFYGLWPHNTAWAYIERS